jgi:hypothetical protein
MGLIGGEVLSKVTRWADGSEPDALYYPSCICQPAGALRNTSATIALIGKGAGSICEERSSQYLWTAVPKAMTFDTKGNQSQAVEEMLARIGRLSAADRRAFMKAIRQQERKDDIAWLHKVWGRVTISDREITRIVEEVRTEMHAAHSHKARR